MPSSTPALRAPTEVEHPREADLARISLTQSQCKILKDLRREGVIEAGGPRYTSQKRLVAWGLAEWRTKKWRAKTELVITDRGREWTGPHA